MCAGRSGKDSASLFSWEEQYSDAYDESSVFDLVKKCYRRAVLPFAERFLRHVEFNMLQCNCQSFAGSPDR